MDGKIKRGLVFVLNGGVRFNGSYSTISASYGVIYSQIQVADLYGSVPALTFTQGTRTWTSSYSTLVGGAIYAFSLGYTGGADVLFTIGEPTSLAFTMGHQRPALLQKTSDILTRVKMQYFIQRKPLKAMLFRYSMAFLLIVFSQVKGSHRDHNYHFYQH